MVVLFEEALNFFQDPNVSLVQFFTSTAWQPRIGQFGIFALLLATVFSANVAWLFLATALFYFMNYEVLHLAYHLPDAHLLARLSIVRRLAWLHRTHHDPRRMAHANFNISYPVCDRVFGTLRRD